MTSRQPVVDQLTQREKEILGLIVEGLSNAEIAHRLFLSLATVKVHTRHIYGKLGVNSRAQAVAATRVSGLLDSTSTAGEPFVPQHNFPYQPIPFIGRITELAAVARRLEDPACRLLTVVGPGGIGKTRLALQAAKQQFAAFAQGVYFASLAPLNAPDGIVSTIAEAIRFSFYPGAEPQQQLLDYLRAKQLLLVLDNFEHLLTSASLVVAILAAAPRVKVLVTSRERLNVQAETVFSLDGMAYPPQAFAADAAEYGAVKLFLQSAAQVQADFPLTTDNLEVVATICRQVQGMPLGILLAAAWVGVLSIQEIAKEIQNSLDFLETEQRDLPERQRSLRAAFAHSWNLLTDSEREVFKKLSVFRGGFTREAAQQVAGASLKALLTLDNKSLLRRDSSSGRYEIHELLRQYGEDQLIASPAENEAVQQLHGEFYSTYMQRQWTAMMSLRQGAVLKEIGIEFNNVVKAWNYAVTNHWADMLKTMQFCLWYYCTNLPDSAGADLFGRAAAALQSIPAAKETEIALGLMLARHVWFVESSQRRSVSDKSLAILRKYHCPEEMVVALEALAWLAGFITGDFAGGIQAAQEGAHIAQEHNIQWGIGHCLFQLAFCSWENGYLVQARAAAQKGFLISEALGDVWQMAGNAYALGFVAIELQDYEEAKWRFEQAIPWFKEIGKPWETGLGYSLLGKVALLTKDFEKAKYWFQQSFYYVRQRGRLGDYLEPLCDVGNFLAAQGQREDAVTFLSVVKNEIHAQDASVLETLKHDKTILNLATALLTDLQAALPNEAFSAAIARGKALDLDTIVGEFLSK